MYNHKNTNKTNKRKQKRSRKTNKHTKKQTKCLGGNETHDSRETKKIKLFHQKNDAYTPKSSEEMRHTISYYMNYKKMSIYKDIKDSPNYKGPISSWNVSNIKDMSSMFYGYELFNEDLSNWDVSNVEDMSRMFAGCRLFNQPLDNWDVSNVENMRSMFSGCEKFNQSLDKWNVSNVKDMTELFYNCREFSQNLDSWTTKLGNLQNLADMFEGCEKFDKKRFIRKIYKETFESDDDLYKYFKYDYIITLIIIYNKNKNIENFTICHAIYLYNHVFDNYIIGLLRNNERLKKKLNPKLLEIFSKIIHTIDNYFESQSSPKSTKGMKLYRGENKLCEGDTCRMGVITSYSSTSKEPDVAFRFTNREECCLYTYELEEGIPYIDVTEIMDKNKQALSCGTELELKHKGEFEIILPRGIILKRIREEETVLNAKRIRTFIMSISYDENYIKNNPINFQ